MAKAKGNKTPTRAPRGKDANPRKYKKKTSPLVIDKVEYVDYKDVDLLSRFMSDRAKIRNRAGRRQRPPAAARDRQRDQDRSRDGAAAVRQARRLVEPCAARRATAIAARAVTRPSVETRSRRPPTIERRGRRRSTTTRREEEA